MLYGRRCVRLFQQLSSDDDDQDDDYISCGVHGAPADDNDVRTVDRSRQLT